MRELKEPGAQISVGTVMTGMGTARYGMIGDTYMHSSEVAARATRLSTAAVKLGRPEWLTQIALRMGVAELAYPGELGFSDAAMILARAHVTWADVCAMKS